MIARSPALPPRRVAGAAAAAAARRRVVVAGDPAARKTVARVPIDTFGWPAPTSGRVDAAGRRRRRGRHRRPDQ